MCCWRTFHVSNWSPQMIWNNKDQVHIPITSIENREICIMHERGKNRRNMRSHSILLIEMDGFNFICPIFKEKKRHAQLNLLFFIFHFLLKIYICMYSKNRCIFGSIEFQVLTHLCHFFVYFVDGKSEFNFSLICWNWTN